MISSRGEMFPRDLDSVIRNLDCRKLDFWFSNRANIAHTQERPRSIPTNRIVVTPLIKHPSGGAVIAITILSVSEIPANFARWPFRDPEPR